MHIQLQLYIRCQLCHIILRGIHLIQFAIIPQLCSLIQKVLMVRSYIAMQHYSGYNIIGVELRGWWELWNCYGIVSWSFSKTEHRQMLSQTIYSYTIHGEPYQLTAQQFTVSPLSVQGRWSHFKGKMHGYLNCLISTTIM